MKLKTENELFLNDDHPYRKEDDYSDWDGLTCDYCGGDGGFTKDLNPELKGDEVCCDRCFELGSNRYKMLK